MENAKVLIIGSGPAGCTAAIYTARAQLEPVMITGNEEGGQLMITTAIENFPGFPEGINGPELMENMMEQAQKFGTRVVRGEVRSVNFSKHPFEVEVDDKVFKAITIIIASGATARWLDLPSVKLLRGFGVSACAVCDAFFFKDKSVVVVGGGDSAMEEAMFLTKFAKKVYLVHRRDQLRASKIMQQKAFNNMKIEFIWDTIITDILDSKQKKVTGVQLQNVKTQEYSTLDCDGVFMALGHQPNTEVFQGQLDIDENGFIKAYNCTMTNIPGVFVAGDVMDPIYKQAVTAAGNGCRAAIDAEHWIEGIFDNNRETLEKKGSSFV